MERRDSPTFHQLLHAANLLAAIYRVDGANPLGQIQIVRQGARQLHQQRVVGAEAVTGHGVNQPLEVAVPVAVEPDLFGLFLRSEGLQGAGSIVATVGTVGGAWDQAAAPGAGAGTTTAGAGFLPLGAGGASPPNFVTFVKVLQLEGLAQRHAVFWVTNRSHSRGYFLFIIQQQQSLIPHGLNFIPGSVLHFIPTLESSLLSKTIFIWQQ